jgi:hypothetical protein
MKQTIGIKPADQSLQGNAVLQHRAVHFLSFGFPGLLLAFISPRVSNRVLFCLAIISFGISIEFAQSVIFTSAFEWWDVRDDLYGMMMVSVVGLLIRSAVIHLGLGHFLPSCSQESKHTRSISESFETDQSLRNS